MLRMMEREEITKYWDQVSDAVKNALPPGEYNELQLMRRATQGDMQVWMMLGEGDPALKGIVTTFIITDFITGARKLYIYSLTMFVRIGQEAWHDNMMDLMKFARGAGCYVIEAETQSNEIRKLSKMLSGQCKEFIRITFGVPNESNN